MADALKAIKRCRFWETVAEYSSSETAYWSRSVGFGTVQVQKARAEVTVVLLCSHVSV